MTAATLAPGTQVGKYQVLRQLAVGGMAEIYLARATGLGGFEKAVVLKRILPNLADDPKFVDMFLDEARLTASLNHPNVVQVYDVDRLGQSFFFTMEFVHGRDLTAVLAECAKKKRGLTLSLALHVVKEVAAGLHYAHDKKGRDGQPIGTVHRDVSPNNVMITYEGGVKIVDFGIAKAAVRVTETESGTVKGTIYYMSPEQAQGHELDRRSDVFSLGVLLYELTTGRRPFAAPNDYAVLFKLVNETPPLPSERRPSYPPALEQIVMKALCRRREERYATADELRRALDDFMRHESLSASSASLGSFMRELFGEREDTADLFALPPLPAPAAAPPPPESSADETTRPITPGFGSAATKVVSDAVVIPVERSRFWLWALLGLALVGAGLTWRFFAGSAPEPAPAAPSGVASSPAPPAPSAAPSPAPPSATATPATSATPSASASAAPRDPTPRPTAAPAKAPAPAPASADQPKGKKWDLDSPLPP